MTVAQIMHEERRGGRWEQGSRSSRLSHSYTRGTAGGRGVRDGTRLGKVEPARERERERASDEEKAAATGAFV